MSEGPFNYYVIFGAAVRPDGTPSGTLERRTLGAWALGQGDPMARFLPTGGQGRYGPPEAHVMRDLLLTAGANGGQIVLEDQAINTLDSVLRCRDLLAQQPGSVGALVVCSSPYHSFRCQLLFRLAGMPAQRGAVASDRPALGTAKWLFYWGRELLAIPWSVVRLLWTMMRARRQRA